LRKTADQQYINQAVGLFKVITYDHRNTGKSTIKDEPLTMEDYADDAAALIEYTCPGKIPVYVIGISFGGMVAQHLALRHPHLIKKLVLCCCATGGAGGMSYPIHEWYEPSVSLEERVNKRLSRANTDRDEKWKETSKTEYAMTFSILSRDEKIGAEDPLRSEGIMRQLEARKNHNTYESIHELNAMDVLVLGSGKDNITPTALLETLASKIGDNCESKLDFDWGHPFIAADVNAMPYVSDWLRKPLRKLPSAKNRSDKVAPKADATTADQVQIWKVVGGADKGGIIVRAGQETNSEQQADRLSHGALISQLQLKSLRQPVRG
jgi:3-oxoadipate enol-lactonase